MPPGSDADLEGTAFLYILGDLPPDEEAAFERRMADDQAAREAVAGAVELHGLLAAVGPGAWALPRTRRSTAHRALAWSSLAIAASLLVAMVGIPRSDRADPVADPAEVAMAWTGLRSLEPIGSEVDGFDSLDDSTATDPTAAPGLPTWLQAAADEAHRDDPRPEEN